MAFLMRARSSFCRYTLRASATKSSLKACALSCRRMLSSMSHRRSLTAFRSARRRAMSLTAAGCAIQVLSSALSSAWMLASLAASSMRSDLICRIEILSSSSPKDTGTRISAVMGDIRYRWQPV
ncbi:hypothetical protein D3C71_1713630 [compost metagenome]